MHPHMHTFRHVQIHILHFNGASLRLAPSPCISHTCTQTPTLFLHSSPVWHTSSKPTNTSKTALHQHQPLRQQCLLKTCTAESHKNKHHLLLGKNKNSKNKPQVQPNPWSICDSFAFSYNPMSQQKCTCFHVHITLSVFIDVCLLESCPPYWPWYNHWGKMCSEWFLEVAGSPRESFGCEQFAVVACIV